jgi:hypothetical protein
MQDRDSQLTGKQIYDKVMGTTMEDLHEEIRDLKSLLGDVLKNDEYLEGFNEDNLGHELRERIREAISDMIPDPCKLPCDANNACDECSPYWTRMRNEGLWIDGVGWSDNAIRNA